MKTLRVLVTMACLVVLLALASCNAPGRAELASSSDAAAIRVEELWIRPPATPAGNGALYMTLVNLGGTADRLLTVETPIAQTAELHETQNDNGVMRMRPLAGGVEIPARQEIAFAPGGKHVMLMNVAESLTVGQRVTVVLTFEKAGDLRLSVPVALTAP